MSQRFYVLLDDVSRAKQAYETLRGEGISRDQLYFLARDASALEGLPIATMQETSDFMFSAKLGFFGGGGLGLLVGIAIASSFGNAISGGVKFEIVLLAIIGCALVSFILTSIAGASFTNKKLVPFQGQLDQGCVVLIANIPKARVSEFPFITAP